MKAVLLKVTFVFRCLCSIVYRDSQTQQDLLPLKKEPFPYSKWCEFGKTLGIC